MKPRSVLFFLALICTSAAAQQAGSSTAPTAGTTPPRLMNAAGVTRQSTPDSTLAGGSVVALPGGEWSFGSGSGSASGSGGGGSLSCADAYAAALAASRVRFCTGTSCSAPVSSYAGKGTEVFTDNGGGSCAAAIPTDWVTVFYTSVATTGVVSWNFTGVTP